MGYGKDIIFCEQYLITHKSQQIITEKSDTNGQTTTDITNANINSDEAVKASISESEIVLNNSIDVINESSEEAADLDEADIEHKIDYHENINNTLVTGVCANRRILIPQKM